MYEDTQDKGRSTVPSTGLDPIDFDPEVVGSVYDDDESMASGSLRDSTTSIASSIFQYRHINGRPFQQSKTTEYWHHCTLVLLDNKLHQSPNGENPQKILDVGTSTGIWAIDMADEYPSAEVIGIDISAVQPAFVPPNCIFQIDDVQLDWTFEPNDFDFIHLRYLYGAIADWQKLFHQAYTHVRPGCWVESLEIDIETRSENLEVQNDKIHVFRKWYRLFFECGRKTGRTFEIARDGRQEEYMQEAGFTDLVSKSWKFPIGGWTQDKKLKQVGLYNGAFIDQSIDGFAVFPIGEILGWPVEEVTALVNEMRKAFKDPKALPYFVVHMVYGRKPEKKNS
ncbi:unnamed protein product [Fusarium langsethiae]|nr:unnamed protein product [Fusarium langsethiae]